MAQASGEAVGGQPIGGHGHGTLPSLREMLGSAFADRRRILAAGGGVLGLALLLALLIPAKYAAQSSLVVLLGSEFTLRPEVGAPPSASQPMTSDEIMKAEIEILSGDDLHEQIVRHIGLATLYPTLLDPPGLLSQARTALLDGWDGLQRMVGVVPEPRMKLDPVQLAVVTRFDPDLTVEATKDANVLTVTFRHKDAATAARVVNDLVAAYLERRRAIYGDMQSDTVEQQAGSEAAVLATADARLAAFKADHAISSYGTERDLLLHRRDLLLGEAQQAHAQQAGLTQRVASLGAELATTPQSVLAYTESDPDARASAAMAGLQDLRGKAADMATRFQPGSRLMADMQSQLAAREAELRRVTSDRAASALRTTRNATYDSLVLDRLRAETDLRAAVAQEAVATAQAGALATQLVALDRNEDELDRLTRARALAESTYGDTAKLLEDRRMVEAVAAARAANVRVIQAARVPIKPRPLKLIIALVGVVASLMAAAGTAVSGEVLRRGFIAPETLERRLGLPVLACVPEWS